MLAIIMAVFNGCELLMFLSLVRKCIHGRRFVVCASLEPMHWLLPQQRQMLIHAPLSIITWTGMLGHAEALQGLIVLGPGPGRL